MIVSEKVRVPYLRHHTAFDLIPGGYISLTLHVSDSLVSLEGIKNQLQLHSALIISRWIPFPYMITLLQYCQNSTLLFFGICLKKQWNSYTDGHVSMNSWNQGSWEKAGIIKPKLVGTCTCISILLVVVESVESRYMVQFLYV